MTERQPPKPHSDLFPSTWVVGQAAATLAKNDDGVLVADEFRDPFADEPTGDDATPAAAPTHRRDADGVMLADAFEDPLAPPTAADDVVARAPVNDPAPVDRDVGAAPRDVDTGADDAGRDATAPPASAAGAPDAPTDGRVDESVDTTPSDDDGELLDALLDEPVDDDASDATRSDLQARLADAPVATDSEALDALLDGPRETIDAALPGTDLRLAAEPLSDDAPPAGVVFEPLDPEPDDITAADAGDDAEDVASAADIRREQEIAELVAENERLQQQVAATRDRLTPQSRHVDALTTGHERDAPIADMDLSIDAELDRLHVTSRQPLRRGLTLALILIVTLGLAATWLAGQRLGDYEGTWGQRLEALSADLSSGIAAFDVAELGQRVDDAIARARVLAGELGERLAALRDDAAAPIEPAGPADPPAARPDDADGR